MTRFLILDLEKYMRLPVFPFIENRVQMALLVLKVADLCNRLVTIHLTMKLNTCFGSSFAWIDFYCKNTKLTKKKAHLYLACLVTMNKIKRRKQK